MKTNLPVAEFLTSMLHKVKKSTESICTCEQQVKGTALS